MQKGIDRFPQCVKADRFAKHNIDILRLGAGDFDQRAKAGEKDDGNVWIDLLDEAGHLVAAHFRHGAIGYDEIEALLFETLQTFAAAVGGGDAMSVATQIGREDFAHARFVIDDENIQR